MTINSRKAENMEFMFSFGQFIVVWNHIELAARSILSWLAGDNTAAKILAYQIGNTSLTDAVRISSDWHPEAKEHLVHFANMMDTIRAYRNYYVHNLIGIGKIADTPEPVGLVMALNVRGKFVLHEKALRIADLDFIANHADQARQHGLKIVEILRKNSLADRIDAFASLEKPDLPKTLEKTVRDLTAPSSPPQSSEA